MSVMSVAKQNTYILTKAIKLFTTRFFNRLDCYYIWDEYLGRYDAKRKPVTPALVLAHLNHQITLSVPTLNLNSYCLWCAWDSDDDNEDLNSIEKVLIDLAWHPLREAKRKGRQGHTWLFFDIAVKAADLRLFNKAIIKRAGIENAGIEFFPKQDCILPEGMGSGLRLPLGKNPKTTSNGAIGWFESCPERTTDGQLNWFAIQPVNPGNKIADIARMIRLEEAAQRTKLCGKKSNNVYRGKIDFKQIAQAALQQAPLIVSRWLPGGKGSVHYTALNPRRADNHAGSFTINLRRGCWKDFACDVGGGDLISLVAYLDDCSQLEAAKKLASFIGLENG